MGPIQRGCYVDCVLEMLNNKKMVIETTVIGGENR